ncbi:MAG: methyltransferase domain-containing protein [Candidatus Promineofilum sp.]|nr:methyltransferase domain-containing protein [Promineifilum sp.]
MTCCPHCQGADRFFNERVAAADLRNYRRHGPSGTTKRLLDALRVAGVKGMTLLDVGGGIGVIQHELSAAGVSKITGVDASRAYLALARQEAEKRGYAAGADYVHGDFVALAERIEPADIVTLDRVICCYPHMEALVNAAAGHAQRFLGLVYPRDGWWMKVGVMVLNLYPRLQNDAFRSYIHPTAAVEEIVATNGLRKIVHHDGSLWQVAVFAK